MKEKKEKLQLPQVTLVAMTSVNIKETIKAMEYSMKGIDFGDEVLITHKKPFGLPKTIRYSYTDELKNIDDFLFLVRFLVFTGRLLAIRYAPNSFTYSLNISPRCS